MGERHISLYRPLMNYIEFWERLSARSIPLIEQVAHPGIRYIDPHHNFGGAERLSKHLEERFETFERIKFKCTNFAWGERDSGNTAYMRWELLAQRKKHETHMSGIAELTFSEEGKVISHIDYWHGTENIFEKPSLLKTLLKKQA